MILKLKMTEGSQGLSHVVDHGSDLTRLNVDVPSGTPYTEIGGYLQAVQLGAGTPADESTVWLHIGSLGRELAKSPNIPDTEGFDRLIDHARARGWLDQSGSMVRVRLVYY